MATALIIIIAIVLVLLLIILSTSLKIVRPTHRGLVERLGKYKRFVGPGLAVIWPFGLERLIRVNTTEMMVSSEKREIITSDSLNAIVDSNIYFRVKLNEDDVKASQYSINNYQLQIVALAKTTLRNIIGTMTLRDANSKRGEINKALYDLLSKETASWGIEIVRTELKEIVPPKEVQDVMNRVVIANNEKIAAVDFATATETKADGERRAVIKKAEGQKEAAILEAQGRAESIRLVNEAADKYFVGNAQLLKSLDTVVESLKDNSKIVLPEGKSLVNVIGDLVKLPPSAG